MTGGGKGGGLCRGGETTGMGEHRWPQHSWLARGVGHDTAPQTFPTPMPIIHLLPVTFFLLPACHPLPPLVHTTQTWKAGRWKAATAIDIRGGDDGTCWPHWRVW